MLKFVRNVTFNNFNNHKTEPNLYTMRPLTLLVILVISLILLFWGCGSYNGLVTSDETVKEAWGNVENAYQRRADLIPNLVNTVKGQADFERGTLESVVKARASATSVKIDANNLSPEKMAQFQKAQSQLSGALSRLLVTVEKYPDLKANQAFIELQAQLEGTENRIKVARDKYNGVVKNYNIKVRQMPTAFVAGITGFDTKGMFEADAGAENAPKVEF